MTNWYQTHPFSKPPLLSKSAMPPLSIIALENMALITVTGDDTVSYLQGQLTCDLACLEKTDLTLAAHCETKGKVFSIIRLFYHQNGMAYIQPKSVVEKQLIQMRKYAVFSNVTFEQSELVLIGIAGAKADNAVQSRFICDGNVRATQTGTAVKIDTNRWLLAVSPAEADSIISELGNRAVLSDQSLWDLYEIRAGIPCIEETTSVEFIPQSLNLQALNAISFKKGCYAGQETVARAKYRGINKRGTYLLKGEAQITLKAGDLVDRSVGANWRSGGVILSSYQFDDGKTLALVVLPNNLDSDTQFRLPETDKYWQKLSLPYEIEENA